MTVVVKGLIGDPTPEQGARLLDERCRFWGPLEFNTVHPLYAPVGTILRVGQFAFVVLRARGTKILVDRSESVYWGDGGGVG